MQTSRATFVVTDTETTGTSASRNRIIEIGAVKTRNGEVVDRFEQLINPGRAISRTITRLTGISTALVFDKPAIAEVLPAYLEFLGDGLLVAHNASFDLRFLNSELQRTGLGNIEGTSLCTLRLARRLLPGLRSKGLSSLINFYQINPVKRHRALGDAEVTADILGRFLAQLRFEHNVETVSQLLRFQRMRYRDVRKVPNHVRKIRSEILPDVPASPGVYTMRASNENPIYIGKARNLKSRVRSYFTSIESHDGHRQKIVQRVRSVTWQEVPSELDALMLESRLIKQHIPKYNRAQRSYRRCPFLKIAIDRTYPGVGWTYKCDDPSAEYYGPLRSKKEGAWLVEVIGRYFALRECDDTMLKKGKRCYLGEIERCMAPCQGIDAGEYAKSLLNVQRFLSGDAEEVLNVVDVAMRKAASEMEFERAAELRDEKKQIARFALRQACHGGPTFGRHEILVLKKRPVRQVLFVRRGQHVQTLNVVGAEVSVRARLVTALRSHYSSENETGQHLSVQDIHEMRLLTQWMYRRRSDLVRIPVGGKGREETVDRVMVVLEGKLGEAA